MASCDEAARLVEATLSTLGEHLYRTRREQSADQLPHQLEPWLDERGRDQNTRQDVERYGVEAFYHCVGARAGIDHRHAIAAARAVMEVPRDAVSAGAWEHMVAHLSHGYDELVGSR